MIVGTAGGAADLQSTNTPFRPPSVPLVACDPYFSIWSPSDTLPGADTVHWTGKPQRLTSLVRIDGKSFRLMGNEPANIPAVPQSGLEVLPTRTIYTFAGPGVKLTLTFMTPALPDDLAIYSRPVTYLTWTATALDGGHHAVQVECDLGAELALNDPAQPCAWEDLAFANLRVLKVGSTEQPVLKKKGDDLRIDWGWLYAAASAGQKSLQSTIGKPAEIRSRFVQAGSIPKFSGLPKPGSPEAGADVMAFRMEMETGPEPVSRNLILAYDDEYSIQYFGVNLRPYWRRNGDDAEALLKKSAAEYGALARRCAAFDEELMADLRRIGGEPYARLCALAYRQCVAANKVAADPNGRPLMFPKENFSNGCIGTLDVIYPMAPQFLLFSPALTRAMLVPILDYASSPRWKFPFAPHDLGTYPLANGQVYGGGEKTEKDQMPVEETGNILILVAALAQAEGNTHFCDPYWPLLEKWAGYLKEKGFDPENQLCTDDFAGHMAHNVNLSGKAIVALACFAQLGELRGDTNAAAYRGVAEEFARQCAEGARDEGHYRLALDKPGSWSQKYNAVWDRVLGLDLAGPNAWRAEMDWYRSHLNRYGLPLDSRKDYTKLDWTVWTATLTGDRADFDALLAPVYVWVNETQSRVPLTDWYDTKTGLQSGFQARSVVGGLFLPVLYDRETWKKWAGRGK